MSPSRPEMARERVLRVRAKSLARSAKERRRLFLILEGGVSGGLGVRECGDEEGERKDERTL